MAEQVLDVELACILLDGPDGEGMTEAVAWTWGTPARAPSQSQRH